VSLAREIRVGPSPRRPLVRLVHRCRTRARCTACFSSVCPVTRSSRGISHDARADTGVRGGRARPGCGDRRDRDHLLRRVLALGTAMLVADSFSSSKLAVASPLARSRDGGGTSGCGRAMIARSGLLAGGLAFALLVSSISSTPACVWSGGRGDVPAVFMRSRSRSGRCTNGSERPDRNGTARRRA